MPSPPASISIAAEVLSALATLPTTTPTVADVAAELGRSPSRVRAELGKLERTGIVEQWPDAGGTRVMLSARSACRLGLRLSPRGDRWAPRLDPRRPPR